MGRRSSIVARGLTIQILHHNAANRDVSLAFVYLGERNFDVANRFLSAVDSDVKKLAEMPGMGAIREFEDARLAGVRSWPVSGFRNYLIFYRMRGNILEFMRLIHGAQDLEAALLSTY